MRETSYLVCVQEEPIIAGSAFKHGLTRDEILHAYRNPIRVWDLGDGGERAMVKGNAMHAREKFLR